MTRRARPGRIQPLDPDRRLIRRTTRAAREYLAAHRTELAAAGVTHIMWCHWPHWPPAFGRALGPGGQRALVVAGPLQRDARPPRGPALDLSEDGVIRERHIVLRTMRE